MRDIVFIIFHNVRFSEIVAIAVSPYYLHRKIRMNRAQLDFSRAIVKVGVRSRSRRGERFGPWSRFTPRRCSFAAVSLVFIPVYSGFAVFSLSWFSSPVGLLSFVCDFAFRLLVGLFTEGPPLVPLQNRYFRLFVRA